VRSFLSFGLLANGFEHLAVIVESFGVVLAALGVKSELTLGVG